MHLLGAREEEKCALPASGTRLRQRSPALATIRAQQGQIASLYPAIFAQEWEIRTIREASPAPPELQAAHTKGRGKEAVRALPASSTSGNPPSPSSKHLSQQLAGRYPESFNRDKEVKGQNPDLWKSQEPLSVKANKTQDIALHCCSPRAIT